MKKISWSFLLRVSLSCALLLIFGVILIYCPFAVFYNGHAKSIVCEEYCKPRDVARCETKQIKFWHPGYVDVEIYCEERKENRVIKN